MKTCTGCNMQQPKENFHRHPHTRDGLGSRCKRCDTEVKREKRRNQKLAAINIMGGKCQICGYDRCVDAMEFHHKNREEKTFEPTSGKGMEFNKFMAEIRKCMLVCANCHREIHAGLVVVNNLE